MNKHKFLTLCYLCLFVVLNSCNSKVSESISESSYSISVTPVLQENAPALQSFVHAIQGTNWLLFAGRTNRMNDDGGLHGIVSGNYATTSFLPLSFNEDIFVYDVIKDTVSGMSLEDMKSAISANSPIAKAQLSVLDQYETVFRNSNPLVAQDEDYLYVVGGYGTPMGQTTSSDAYQTFNHIAKLHIASMIALVNGDFKSVNWKELMAFGENDKLISTGAELFLIGDKFYLAGGHNFGSSAPKGSNGQRYVDAVYPFTITRNLGGPTLTINTEEPITDMPLDKLGTAYADENSKFRRRDGPVVASLYKENNSLREGLSFYSGVFMPDSTVNTTETVNGKEVKKAVQWERAWTTAIYITPNGSSKFKIDKAYKQTQNVYATAEFEFYDDQSEKVYTYLVGGIGDGKSAGPLQLSGFTNGAVQIIYDLNTATSTWKVENANAYNAQQFYGAESIFMIADNQAISYVETVDGTSEVIDINKTLGTNKSIELGYIYGGIESFEANPGTYGRGKSRASDRVWKVTLTRSSN